MTPTFDSNDLVCISDDPGYLATVGIGDVVIAPCEHFGAGYSVIHRIVREVAGGWILRGDGNGDWEDPCVYPKDSVTWKMVAIAKDVF